MFAHSLELYGYNTSVFESIIETVFTIMTVSGWQSSLTYLNALEDFKFHRVLRTKFQWYNLFRALSLVFDSQKAFNKYFDE